ncbi:MAG: hypothetical protein ACRD3J_24965, partial [Thermoanaerobaculia bacterium]
MRARLIAIAFVIFGATGLAFAQTSCIHCHGGELFDEAARAKVKHFNTDVHSQVGLSCHNCHGGNPDPKLGDDIAGAMDPN